MERKQYARHSQIVSRTDSSTRPYYGIQMEIKVLTNLKARAVGLQRIFIVPSTPTMLHGYRMPRPTLYSRSNQFAIYPGNTV